MPSWPSAPIVRGEEAKAAEAAVIERELRWPAPRHPVFGQRPDEHRGRRNDAGLRAVRGSSAGGRRRCCRPHARCGRHSDRQDNDARVWAQAVHRGSFLRATLNPWSQVIIPVAARSGGAAVAVAAGMGPTCPGHRWRRFNPYSGGLLWRGGSEGHAWRDPEPAAPDLFGANSFVGPMARDVAGTQLMFEVLEDPTGVTPMGRLRLRCGVPMLKASVPASGSCSAAAISSIRRSKHPSSLRCSRPKSLA